MCCKQVISASCALSKLIRTGFCSCLQPSDSQYSSPVHSFLYSSAIHPFFIFSQHPHIHMRLMAFYVGFFCANLLLLHILLIATYLSKVRISHIFLHKLAFLTAVLISFVFLLPISIRFRYLDHLVVNRMAPSMCPDPCGTRWGSWFQAVLYYVSTFLLHIWCLSSLHFNLKLPHKTDMPI